jgi:L-ascorbate metabolism protein UlaG (beta-lactamase superfamily)
MIKFRWTGCAGVEITQDGKTVLIDPYHTRLSAWKLLFGRHEPLSEYLEQYVGEIPGELSAIIVGHTHLDHAMDVPVLSRWCRGPVVGSRSLKTLMDISGAEKEVTVTWGRKSIDLFNGARLTMIPSRHGRAFFGRVPFPGEIDPAGKVPLKASGYRLGEMFTPKLEIGGKTFLHVGSANLVEEELDGHRCDVLLMCVPGWHKTPGYISRLLEITKPQVIIPIHFDDFTRPVRRSGHYRQLSFLRMKEFTERVRSAAPGASFRKPRPFQTMLI